MADVSDNNVTNELLLEHLRAIQTKLSDQGERLSRIEAELRTTRAHVAALVQSDLNRDADYASLVLRIERIERRLELTPA